MKFIANRIMTRKVSLEDAIKASKEPSEELTFEQVLEKIANKRKENPESEQTKVLETKKATVEVKIDQALQKEAKEAFPGAVPFKAKDEVDSAEDDEDDEDDEDKDKTDKKDKKDKKSCMASGKKLLKIAKQLDFRSWEAEDVVKAWEQHGSIKGCIKNVTKETSDPKTYCGLLQVASQVAGEIMVKKAKATKGQAKTAKKNIKTSSETKKRDTNKGVWKKIAKLTDKERGMLKEYWAKLYGDKYVQSLLNDY